MADTLEVQSSMPLGFNDLQTQVFAHYGQGRFAEALELVRRALPELPEHRSRLSFWQACCLCRLDRAEEAMTSLEAHGAAGVWWNPQRLAADPDLAALHGRPAFDALVEASRARQELEQANTRLEVEVVEAKSAGHNPLLMAFHMRGSSLAATLPYWRSATQLGVTVAVPQSSQLLGPGEYAWTDPERADKEALEAFRQVQSAYEVDRSRVVLGGASQGASLALRLALQEQPIPARGFVAVAGGGRAEALEPLFEGAAQRGVRGTLIIGERDPARAPVEELHEALSRAGLVVRLEVVPGLGHDYPGDFDGHMQTALRFVLGTV